MPTTGAAAQDRAAIPVDRATLFVSLELSRSRWLVTFAVARQREAVEPHGSWR
jgi:hypothetical protein